MAEEEARVDQGRSGVLYDLETHREWSESPEAPLICLNGCGTVAGKPDQMQRLRTLKVLQKNPLIAILKCGLCCKRWLRVE